MRMPWSKTAPEMTTLAPTDVEAIKAKLADCQSEIEAAERDLQRVSLSAVLGDRETDASEAARHLAQLRDRRELLWSALRAAEQAEADALAATELRTHHARVRSLQQHLGRLEREAADFSAALSKAHDVYSRVLDAASSARAALLPSMRTEAAGFPDLLSPAHLQRLAQIELHRVSRDGAHIIPRPAGLGEFERRSDGRVTPLAETLAGIASGIRDRLRASKPQSSPPALVQPVLAQASPAVTPPAGDAVLPRTLDSRGEVLDLRGHDLGISKPSADETAELEEVIVDA